MKTIKQVSKLSGASVRTLQYYDNIHLLTPSQRTASGYRLYSDDDIAKLQQILFLKALGFSLKDIRELISHPDFNQNLAFRKQKELLCAKRRQVGQVIQILKRLENGASLDDCAADIRFIAKEPKFMQKSIKLSLFVVSMILFAGAVRFYQISQTSTPEPDMPAIAVTDIIKINPVTTDGVVRAYALDIVSIVEEDLPKNSPTLDQIILPEDLRNEIRLEAFYPHAHSVDDKVRSYSIKTSDGARYIYIGFSPDHTPIREMYVPEGEPSIINGHEVMIGHYTGQVYLEESGTLELIEKYYIDFVVNGMNYAVETHGLEQAEVVTLIKSLL